MRTLTSRSVRAFAIPTRACMSDSVPSTDRCSSMSISAHQPWSRVLHRLRRFFAGMGVPGGPPDELALQAARKGEKPPG